MKFEISILPCLKPEYQDPLKWENQAAHEITVSHASGEPFEYGIGPFLAPMVSDWNKLYEYCKTAAENNYQSSLKETVC